VAEAVKSPNFNKLAENEGLIMVGGSPQQFEAYVKGEEARWRKVINDAHIRLE
jgi:tripartite-type tricarboxylate transporter receptor subunit TctC